MIWPVTLQTPCLHDTTTGGATGAGNETTETKAGIGIETETETETVIRGAGAAAPAARDDQACTTNPHFLLQPLNCATDRRDYGRDRDEDRRDRDSRDSRRRDERDRRDAPRRDGEKDRDRYERDKRDGEKSRAAEHEAERVAERGTRVDSESRETVKASQSHGESLFVIIPRLINVSMRYVWPFIALSSTSSPRPHDDAGEPEEGEAMEAVNDEDEAMMAMMGLTGFGSTKVLASAFLSCFLYVDSPC